MKNYPIAPRYIHIEKIPLKKTKNKKCDDFGSRSPFSFRNKNDQKNVLHLSVVANVKGVYRGPNG